MKKLLTWILLAAVLLTGCSNDYRLPADLTSQVDPETGNFCFTPTQWTELVQAILGDRYTVTLADGVTTIRRLHTVVTAHWENADPAARVTLQYAITDDSAFRNDMMGACLLACDPVLGTVKAGKALNAAIAEGYKDAMVSDDWYYEQSGLCFQPRIDVDSMNYFLTIYPKPAQ